MADERLRVAVSLDQDLDIDAVQTMLPPKA
jgi:hypothetical protein